MAWSAMKMGNKRKGKWEVETRRITSIEGARAGAILAILLYHFLPHQLPGGFLGVDLFLMLSGFLLTRKLLHQEAWRPTDYLRFAGKRIRRLYPPLLLMMVPVTALLVLFQKELLLNLRGWVFSTLLMVNNWWQIGRQVSYFDQFFVPSVFTHLWYLSLNLQYSLLWPLVLKNRMVHRWGAKKQMLLIVTLVLLSQLLQAVLYVPGADPTRIYYGTDTRFLAFGMGALLAYLAPDVQKRLMVRRNKGLTNLVGAAALALVFVLLKELQDTSAITYYGGMLLHSVAAAAFFLSSLPEGTFFHLLLRFKPLQWLGRRSYYIYLWYYPVFLLAQRLPGSFAGSQALLPLAAIFLLAEGSHRLLREAGAAPGLFLVERWKAWQNSWRDSSGKAWLPRIESIVALAGTGLFLAGIVTAPAGNPPAMEALKERIAENVSKQEDDSQKEPIPVEPIEGLAAEVATFSGNLEATFIGDSILLSALTEIQRVFPQAETDGEVGRQLYQTAAVAKRMRENDTLHDPVVLLLGANGTFTEGQMDTLLATIGREREVYLVTTSVPRSWRDSANGRMWLAQENHSNVHILDWFAVSKEHPEWLSEDGVHPNEEGARQLALFLAQSLFELQK